MRSAVRRSEALAAGAQEGRDLRELVELGLQQRRDARFGERLDLLERRAVARSAGVDAGADLLDGVAGVGELLLEGEDLLGLLVGELGDGGDARLGGGEARLDGIALALERCEALALRLDGAAGLGLLGLDCAGDLGAGGGAPLLGRGLGRIGQALAFGVGEACEFLGIVAVGLRLAEGLLELAA